MKYLVLRLIFSLVGIIAAMIVYIVLYGSETGQPYDRADFGPAWYDSDGNGCNTRDDVIRRQLENTIMESRCEVRSGILEDPYTSFKHQYPRVPIEIDHVVSLHDAWYSGADTWNRNKRIQFANDTENLVATTRESNRAKSNRGPDEWLPNYGPCRYVEQYARIKAKYDLGMTTEQREKVESVMSRCP